MARRGTLRADSRHHLLQAACLLHLSSAFEDGRSAALSNWVEFVRLPASLGQETDLQLSLAMEFSLPVCGPPAEGLPAPSDLLLRWRAGDGSEPAWANHCGGKRWPGDGSLGRERPELTRSHPPLLRQLAATDRAAQLGAPEYRSFLVVCDGFYCAGECQPGPSSVSRSDYTCR